MRSANSSGVLGVMSPELNRGRIAGWPSTLLMSRDSRLTIATGVLAGARIPNQSVASYPGRPASCTVGNWGAAAVRRAPVTARSEERRVGREGGGRGGGEE